jgi:hypothetical protein
MASSRYKNHLIVLRPEYDSRRAVWRPVAVICWKLRGHLQFENLFLFEHEFETLADAESFAREAAEKWVEERIRTGEEASPLRVE